MKKLICAICLVLAGATGLYAQDTTSLNRNRSNDMYQDRDQDHDKYTDKDMISTSDLPAIIQEQLQSTDYSGWAVSKAYRKTKNNKTVYAVDLTKGKDKKKVLFDAQGNKVKEKDKDKDKDDQ